MKEKTVEELKAMMDAGEDFQLVDIREPHERDICNIGGDLLPMNSVPTNLDKISRTKPVIIYCRSGARSARLIHYLEQNAEFDNLYNLDGGILAWADEIDPEMPKY